MGDISVRKDVRALMTIYGQAVLRLIRLTLSGTRRDWDHECGVKGNPIAGHYNFSIALICVRRLRPCAISSVKLETMACAIRSVSPRLEEARPSGNFYVQSGQF